MAASEPKNHGRFRPTRTSASSFFLRLKQPCFFLLHMAHLGYSYGWPTQVVIYRYEPAMDVFSRCLSLQISHASFHRVNSHFYVKSWMNMEAAWHYPLCGHFTSFEHESTTPCGRG